MRTDKSKLLVKTAIRLAIYVASLAIEIFKVQSDYSRIVEVGRKVMRSGGSYSVHVKDRISYFWWETINAFCTPRLVVQKYTASCQCAGLRTKQEQ